MKILVFLLVLGNLLFYAFGAGYFVVPERMKIVSRGEAPVISPKPEPAVEDPKPEAAQEPEAPIKETKADTTPVCLAWRQLSVADADRLSVLLAKRFSGFKLIRKTLAAEGNGWWVFVSPQPNKAEADKKAAELREFGVKDFFVIQDGPNRFAISLGVFSTEKGSQDRLAELKAKGVRSAAAGPRPGKDSVVNLQARGLASEKPALLAAVADALPKVQLQACK